ncbi:S8 family serine peptidase [Actinokineospora auranticolor]|uniref:Subtilase family protein n=1 Tax=Actinokineospora auranticolor TaxID=155976 RepID=A0A2S6GWW4_9PSEU|nr:S8 family serine peptidase [Actinokineospora auranticolor]PPK69687.1 subtilase family protein [Actinokineospora auranticolor]
MHRRSRARLLAAAVVIAAAASVATAAGQATAAPAQVSAAGAAHFVVLGDEGRGLSAVEKAVRDSGGTVVKSWPQIGVVVASSDKADFAKVVRTKRGVQGAGATRNLAELVTPEPTTARIAASADSARSLEATESVVTNGGKGVPSDPGDPLSVNQWNLAAIKADKAHSISGGSRDVVVGVLDSGIEATHPDLAPNIDASRSVGCTDQGVPNTSPAAWAPTTSDHGTHVAGIIAAAKNGVGVVGVAPNVKLASIKVVDDDQFIYPEYAICGFVWAAEHGVKVTNNSYFIDPWFLWCRNDADQRAVVTAVTRAIDYSDRRGVVNVAALGNSNWDLSHNITDSGSPNNGTPTTRETGPECVNIPAETHGVVGVSATGVNNLKSYYSNYGRTETEVAAPGGDRMQVPGTPDANGRILSTVVGGAWGYKQGTSMASPHAAGVVALIRSTHRNWSADRVVDELQHDADRLACPAGGDYDPDGTGAWKAKCEGGASGRGFYGAGLIDALDAVR